MTHSHRLFDDLRIEAFALEQDRPVEYGSTTIHYKSVRRRFP